MNSKKSCHAVQMIVFLMLTLAGLCHAADSVEWKVVKTLDINAEPIDFALSPDGKQLFVLTDKGEILIFASGKNPSHKITVGTHIDRIKVGYGGKVLILSSRKNKKVTLITLDFIKPINISGSPFKGSENAPIVIAVFSDFE